MPDICLPISVVCKSCQLGDAFRRECTKIDVEIFRRVIHNPDGWIIVENRDRCEGLYRNGTISWLGPRNFARVFKVLGCALRNSFLVILQFVYVVFERFSFLLL